MNTEEQARLKILLQNRKDLQIQVAKIRQTIKKLLDKNTSLAEIIRTLFREQGITIFSILTALSMMSLLLQVFWGKEAEGQEVLHQKTKSLEKIVRQASKPAQKTCRKCR